MYCRTLQGGVAYMSDGTATFTSCTFSGNSAVRPRNLCSIPRSIGSLACVAGIGWCMRRGREASRGCGLVAGGHPCSGREGFAAKGCARLAGKAPPRVRHGTGRRCEQGVMRGSVWFGVCSSYERLLPLVRDDAALERARRCERGGLSRGCGGALRMRHRDGSGGVGRGAVRVLRAAPPRVRSIASRRCAAR